MILILILSRKYFVLTFDTDINNQVSEARNINSNHAMLSSFTGFILLYVIRLYHTAL